jgi:hypothetical protein
MVAKYPWPLEGHACGADARSLLHVLDQLSEKAHVLRPFVRDEGGGHAQVHRKDAPGLEAQPHPPHLLEGAQEEARGGQEDHGPRHLTHHQARQEAGVGAPGREQEEPGEPTARCGPASSALPRRRPACGSGIALIL